jgi:uncharacterized protein YkwD
VRVNGTAYESRTPCTSLVGVFSHPRLGILVALLLPLALALANAVPASAADCKDQDLQPTGTNAVQIRGALRCLTNKERSTRGKAPLTANRELRRAAEGYAKLMVAQHFSAHVSLAGSTVTSRVKKTAYLRTAARWVVGENLGDGEDPRSTPRELMVAWMASASHRRHILDGTYRDIGIGVVRGTPGRDDGPGATYCVEFGRTYKR